MYGDIGVADTLPLNSVGVLGATSFVGKSLLPLLTSAGCEVSAYSRQPVQHDAGNVKWFQLDASHSNMPTEVTSWICVAPIWVLSAYLPWLKSKGAQRVVVLSSTSRFTKTGSSDVSEQALAKSIAGSEQQLIEWAEANGITWIILRPTLIYGLGLDKNVGEIACFIRRFSFFPVFGKARGLRQPIHVQDVASACVAALRGSISNRAYNISGREKLTYREMVGRVFNALGRTPRMLPVPLAAFRLAVAMLRLLPRFRKWTPAMAERMNQDMVFDHTEAAKDLGFNPRPFVLDPADLPN